MVKKHDLKEVVFNMIPENSTLYGFIDAARDLELYQIVHYILSLDADTLFQGENAEFTNHVAPHLFPIPPDSEFFDHWSPRRGTSPGILLISSVESEELLDHLRQIFHVTDENDEEYLFRYYDPRVLRPYLPTCSHEQLREFFGPIQAILVESENPDELTLYTVKNKTLSKDLIQLKPYEQKEHTHTH